MIYKFTVPCHVYYEIEEDTEEQARKKLVEQGGIEITGELLIDAYDYKHADLIDEEENHDQEITHYATHLHIGPRLDGGRSLC